MRSIALTPELTKFKMMVFFENVFFSKITFDIRKVRKLILHYRVSLVKARRNMYSMILKGEF